MSYSCQRAWCLCVTLHLSQLTSCRKLVHACLFGRRNDGTYSQDLITDLASRTEICHWKYEHVSSELEALTIRSTPAFSSPLRSVETPVAKRPREATAKEPPRSTERAILACRSMVSLLGIVYPCWQLCLHGGYSDDSVELSAGHCSGVL